jgi:uncharacterized protein (DUF2236 family)
MRDKPDGAASTPGNGAPEDGGGAVVHPFPVRPDRGRVPAADAGPGRSLFTASSVTWRVHGDPLMGVAGLRGLFLHALHPVAMGALADHEARWDPWRRLSRTAHYIGVSTFGSASDAMLAGSRLRAVHARVHGVTGSGRPYTAEDPWLLGWVHNCLVASFLEITTRGGLPLSPDEQDAYIAEQVRTATLVGLEPDDVPRNRAALLDYFRQTRDTLVVTPAARNAVLQALLPAPPTAEDEPRPPWAAVAGLAFSSLPPWARRMYALPELTEAAALDDATTTVALRRLRSTLDGHRWATPPKPGTRRGTHSAHGTHGTHGTHDRGPGNGGGRRLRPLP